MRCGSACPEPADGIGAPEPASTEGARSIFDAAVRRFRPRATASGRLRATSHPLLDVVAPQQSRDRHQDDLQVEPQRPVLDVVVVPLDAVVERRLPAQSLHLRPPGQAGLDAVAVAVAVDVLLEGANEVRALGTRPDDRHVAAQDVEQLRQLVERQTAHDLPDARAAVDALDAAGRLAVLRHELGLGRRRDAHRAELEHVELAAVEADAALAEEDRTGRAEAHGEREHAERDREDQQRDGRDDAIDRVLDPELPAARVDRRCSQQWDAAEVLDLDAVRDLLEQTRDDDDLDAELATATDQAEQHRVGRGRERHDDLLDVVALDDLLEVPAGAEHAQTVLVLALDHRVLVEE